jgi:diguanylate cyclase (GGDEF)-like protein
LLATIPFAIAAIVMGGWALGDDALKRVGLSSVAMNPVTSLGLLLICAGLFVRSHNGRAAFALGTALIGVAGCMGAIKLADVVFGTHFDVDAMLFATQLSAGYARPNQIAPNTAASLVLISAALLLMRCRADRVAVSAQVMAFSVALIALFAMVGHLYGVAAFYVVAALHPMALQSAICFMSLSGFVLLATANRGMVARISDRGPAGRTSRALLPAALVIPLLFGWLRQRGEIAGFYSEEVGVAIMVILTILSMTMLIWLNAGWLLSSDKLRRLAEAEVAHMASHDFLTGLPNRAQFMERLLERMVPRRRRADAVFALLVMDLDGFKQVNDKLGHAAGDALLREVALFLKGCVYRRDDLVARLGGDEFILLLDGVGSAHDATIVATRIVANMPRQFGPEGEEVPIGISVGVVIAEQNVQTAEALLRNGDKALYHAKRTGKGRYSLYQAIESGALEGAL